MDRRRPGAAVPEQASAAQSLRGYLAVIRRQWWVILIVVVACCVAAAIFSTRQDPVYEASTKIVVGQGRALFGPDVSFAVEPFTQTMTELLQSDVVADRVIRDLNLDMTSTELLDDLEVTSKPDTSVLEVTYQDTDRRMAVRTLAEVAATFTELVDQELGGQPGSNQGTGADVQQPEPVSAVVFDPARLEPGQVAPRPLRTTALAIVVGLIAGLALAFLRDALASRIRNQDEAEAALGAGVVGALPRGGIGAKPVELELLSSKSAVRVRQAVDMMSATLRFSLKDEDFSVVLVTSAMPEEGKTTVAANLSHGLAQAGRRVVAVEADTRRPALHAFLGAAPDEPGLLDVARGDASVHDVLFDVPLHSPLLARQEAESGGGVAAVQAPPTGTGQLFLLPAGTRDGGGAPRILSLGQTAAIIADLREVADCIVFDSSPVLLAGDAFPLAQLADRVLVVCRERASSRQQAERLRSRLQSIGVEDFSVVLTESSAATEPGYGYGYGYGPA
jgi:capsular polysaccharide biosynthesis protein/Mrp family chromosome partitioning ATPase